MHHIGSINLSGVPLNESSYAVRTGRYVTVESEVFPVVGPSGIKRALGRATLPGFGTKLLRGAQDRPPPTGNVNWNMAPPVAFAVAQIRPPCASTIDRQIESPIPKPVDLVE